MHTSFDDTSILYKYDKFYDGKHMKGFLYSATSINTFTKTTQTYNHIVMNTKASCFGILLYNDSN